MDSRSGIIATVRWGKSTGNEGPDPSLRQPNGPVPRQVAAVTAHKARFNDLLDVILQSSQILVDSRGGTVKDLAWGNPGRDQPH